MSGGGQWMPHLESSILEVPNHSRKVGDLVQEGFELLLFHDNCGR